MKPSEYVQFIIGTNLKQLKLADDSDFGTPELMANFGFGILEEWQEFVIAHSSDVAKEAGDVLAYYCLLAVSLGFSRDYISDRLSKLAFNQLYSPPILPLAGALKRLFRGDGSVAAVETNAYELLVFVVHNAGIVFEALSDLNKQKLEDRLQRTGTFFGSGDNR